MKWGRFESSSAGTASRLLWTSLLAALVVAAGQDAGAPKPLLADLNGDGKRERIVLEKFAETEDEGEFFQLRVLDDQGGLIWEGPKVADAANPLVFGSWHFGVSLPELAADIDGDGAVELLAPAPQSDVSPTSFRVLKWKGNRFVKARTGNLLESPAGSGRFAWQQSEAWQGRWISSFLAVAPNGFLRVQILEYGGGATVKKGEALVRTTERGFEVEKWTAPLAVMDGSSADQDGVTYRARLGAADHINSKGDRLTKVGSIIRQDRVNFHNGKGDDDDEGDPVFETRSSRETMDNRVLIPVGSDVRALNKAIIDGTPLIDVEVTPKALKVRIIEP